MILLERQGMDCRSASAGSPSFPPVFDLVGGSSIRPRAGRFRGIGRRPLPRRPKAQRLPVQAPPSAKMFSMDHAMKGIGTSVTVEGRHR